MSINLHNFIWKDVRLVQVEVLPHHIAGILSSIRETLENSDCEWEDIYSAYYDCEEDGTTTFYEGESAEAGMPGIWTYVVYDCNSGEEEVVTNLDIDTFDPALKLGRIVVEVAAASSISCLTEQAQKLRDIAIENGISPEALTQMHTDKIIQETEENTLMPLEERHELNEEEESEEPVAELTEGDEEEEELDKDDLDNPEELFRFTLSDGKTGYKGEITYFEPEPSEENGWLYDTETEKIEGTFIDETDNGKVFSFTIAKFEGIWTSSFKPVSPEESA